MIKCKYCGGENPDSHKFCMNCGAPLDHDAQDAVEQQDYAEEEFTMETEPPKPETVEIPPEQFNEVQPHFDPSVNMSGMPVEKIPLGGLIAWAVFVILGCWIPGVVALYYIFKINKAASYEEQQQLLTNAKRILIVGTVLSALNLFRMVGARG